MEKKAAFPIFLAVLVVGGMFFTSPQNAEARWRRGRPYYWHRYEPCSVLPRGFISIQVGGSPYFYGEGLFYRSCPSGYVIVPPPVGAFVPALPDGSQVVAIDGTTYHYYDGVYYKDSPNGYTVVPLSIARAIPVKALPVQEAAQTAAETTTIVNIPNKNGSYTPVTLQLAANGMYIGPQGEVYPTKPDDAQLQEMYGK